MSSMALVTPAPAGIAANTQEDWAAIERAFRGMVARDTTAAQIDAAILVCKSLGFNPILQHINLIDGKVYVTHKGLWNLAHRSKMFNGIEVLDQGENATHYTARVAIFRKDMDHPFTFNGRYPKSGRNKQYGEEMALARAECMALRRAFDVSMPIYEEINWETRAGGDGRNPRAEIREVPRPAPAALPARAEQEIPHDEQRDPAPPAFDFASWSARLQSDADAGIATGAIAAEIKGMWALLDDGQAEAIDLWFRQLRDARKAGSAGAVPEAKSARRPRISDEAILAVVVNVGEGEATRADAARTFLVRATDAEALFARVAQLTVLDFPAPILDVLVAEQRERLGLPDDDAGAVIGALADPDEVVR